MAKVKVYNQAGQEVGDLQLNPSLFEVKIDPAFIHRIAVAQTANSRQVLAHTKGRSEVRGGGKKPWKQKGTGRARHGSNRSPIWVGGGITFGPTKERNFACKINKAERRKALSMVLSDKVANKNFVVVDELNFSEIKTKLVATMLEKLPIGRNVLMILPPENKDTVKATRNIAKVKPISVKSLNIIDLLKNETVVISRPAIEILEKTYLN